jgi:hypothetical protein
MLIVLGMIVLRRPDSTPLIWPALQDTLSQVFHNPISIARGTALILIGMILLGRGVRAFEPQTPGDPPLTRLRNVRRMQILLPVAVVTYISLVGMILSGSRGYPALVVFLLSLIAMGAAGAAIFPAPWRLFSRWELLGLTMAAVAGFLLYVHDSQSWFYVWVGDEWEFFQKARLIADGFPLDFFSQSGAYGSHPVMDSVYQGTVMRVLGATAFGWRASCALATVLGVFPLYLLVRTVYSRVAAAISVGLYLPAHVLMAYTHIGYNEPDALVPLLASVTLFILARHLHARLYLFLAGIVAGLGWYTISTSRVAIGLILLGLLFYRARSWSALSRDVALILGGFVLALLPLVLVNGSYTFTSTVDQARWGLPGVPPLGTRISQNGVRSLYAFVYSTDFDNHYVVGTLFDNVSAFCLLIGMAGLLVWRTMTAAFLFALFWLLVAINGPTYYALHLNTTRMYIVVPFACVIAGIGAAALIRQASSLLPRISWASVATVAASIGIIAAATWQNLDIFYRVMPANMQSTPQALEMEVIQQNPRATIVPVGRFAFDYPFDTAEEAYGVTGRIFEIRTSLRAEVRAAGTLKRSIILVSPDPIDDSAIRGRRVVLFDPAHDASIVVIYNASVAGS